MAEGRVDTGQQPTTKETFKLLWSKRSFRHLAFGAALTAFVGYGLVTWVPSFLIRSHGMTTGEAGTWLGLILGIPGGIGIALGGWMADRYGSKDTRWYMWVVSVALLLGTPFAFGVFLSDSVVWCLLFLIMPVLLGNFYQATTFSQTQGLVELRMRAVAAAVLLFIINIIGLGAGPQAVGIVSDLLNDRFGQESLRYSLLIFSFVNIWAAFHYYKAGQYLKADLVRE
jgi:MFS family permease